ncbi:uncharacterized protein LOC125920704 isoform X2 [Panthera uncia]|uniref:uncharacterized protein LOC125920704 isoform X2 n=1 Tax=Panthera uncia TaxID=29064 RepID=UPI0020FFE62B|nr:uncharacterized protein LOC125920704 isoform X2 [Panthera uncia]
MKHSSGFSSRTRRKSPQTAQPADGPMPSPACCPPGPGTSTGDNIQTQAGIRFTSWTRQAPPRPAGGKYSISSAISVKGCFQAPTLGCVRRCPPSPRSAPLSPLPIHPGKTSSSWPLSPLSELAEPGCGSRLSSTPLASSHVTCLSFPPTKASPPRRRGRGLTWPCALPRDSRHEASPSPSGFIPGRHRRGRGGEGSLLGSWSAFIKEQGLHCVSPLSPSCPGRTGRKTRSRGHSPGGDSCHRRGLLSAHRPPSPHPQPLLVLPVGRLGQAVRRKEDTRRETEFCLAVTEGRRLDEPARLPGAAPLTLWEEPRTTIFPLLTEHTPAWKPICLLSLEGMAVLEQ